jgi:hypothetical protein
MSAAQIAEPLAALISGDMLGYVHAPGERAPIPVRIEVTRAERIEPEDLARAWVANARGERIPPCPSWSPMKRVPGPGGLHWDSRWR